MFNGLHEMQICEETVGNMRRKIGHIRSYMGADLEALLPRPDVTKQPENMTEEVCQPANNVVVEC